MNTSKIFSTKNSPNSNLKKIRNNLYHCSQMARFSAKITQKRAPKMSFAGKIVGRKLIKFAKK
jgi:hypothetical protein